MKSNGGITTLKVVLLTVATFGLYGAYWAMSHISEEPDTDEAENRKDADMIQRAATSAMLMRHDLH